MSDAPPFTLHEGEGRLVISVPHAGTVLPGPVRRQLNPLGLALVDTDWHVDRLYAFAAGLGATVLVATHARTVVDLNRSPDGGLLYPGQAETAICPAESFDGAPLYVAGPPDAGEVAARVRTYWQPYHETLQAQLARVRALHGVVHLLDAHSIRSTVPRLFAGVLPDLNYGTNGGASADPALVSRALAATQGAGFGQVLDGRFRGGHITRHYGDPGHGVHALQLELAQSTYLDEAAPHGFAPDRAEPLIAALRSLVRELLCA